MYNTPRCRKRRRRLFGFDLFVRCWPIFAEWLEVVDVVRIASTCKEYDEYAQSVARAWPFELVVSDRAVELDCGRVESLLSMLSPGQKRITLNYHGLHIPVDGFKYAPRILNQLRRLGVYTLDASYSRFEDPTVFTFLCMLRPQRVDWHMCMGGLHDALITEMAPGIKHLDLSGVQMCEYNPLLSLEGLHSLGQCLRLQSLNLSRLSLVDNTVVRRLRDLPELTELNLQGCHRVTSYTDLNPRLRTLNLSYCGHIDDGDRCTGWRALAALTRLEVLDLSHCIPLDQDALGLEVFRNMRHLKHLNLASNFQLRHVNRFMPDSLESLNLELCYRVDEESLVSALGRLKRLKSLDISCTGYTRGRTLESISPGVECLTCSFSRQSVSFRHLRHLLSLRVLHASVHRTMDGSSLAHLRLEGLIGLTLHRCDELRVSNLHCLRRAGRLEHLCLADAGQLGDSFFVDIASQLPRLRTMRVRASNVTQIGLKSLHTCQLTRLDLADSYLLEGNGLRYLPPGLTSLNIIRCFGIRDPAIDYLRQLPALKCVFVSDADQFSPVILEILQHDKPNLRISFEDEE